MWDWSGVVEFMILQVIPGNEPFNYFFTVVTALGILSWGIVCLVKVVSRS